jgi:hypothetical protein
MAIPLKCQELFQKCNDHVRDNIFKICVDQCHAKYERFPELFEEHKYCLEVCERIQHAALDDCTDELWKCAGVDSREKVRWEEHQKQHFKGFANQARTWGTVTLSTGLSIAFLAAAPEIPGAWAGLGLGVAGIGAGVFLVAGYAIEKADRDPIDYHFTSRARPRPPRPIFVKARPGTLIDADVANAINAVLENQANAIGLDRAIMTSLDRAQGAAVAEEPTYEEKQMKNAREYASKLAIVLRESAELRSKAVTQLRENNIVFTITEDRVYNIREKWHNLDLNNFYCDTV